MTLYQELRLVPSQLLEVVRITDCAWADCWLSAWPIALGQSATSVPISAQLQPNQLIVFVVEGWPDRAWADC